MAVLHVVEQCANARQLGGEIPLMAIPGVGSVLSFRTTAQRGEDLVIGRSLHVAAILFQKKGRLPQAAQVWGGNARGGQR
jgi:hypothetical protein